MSKQRFEFNQFSKAMAFLFLLSIALGMTGIQSVQAHIESNRPIELGMDETEHKHVERMLSDFVGEPVNDVTIVVRSSGEWTTDLNTLQGTQRLVLSNKEGEWQVLDAFRL